MYGKPKFESGSGLRKRIEAGLKDIKKGRMITHEDLKEKLKSRLRKTRRSVR